MIYAKNYKIYLNCKSCFKIKVEIHERYSFKALGKMGYEKR